MVKSGTGEALLAGEVVNTFQLDMSSVSGTPNPNPLYALAIVEN